MGLAAKKKQAKEAEWIADIETCIREGYDIVAIPLQSNDGWFKGLMMRDIPDLLKVWDKYCEGRILNIICMDRFWVELIWRTPQGSEIIKKEGAIAVDLTREARELLLDNTVQHQREGWEQQAALMRSGEWGQAYWGWLSRYVFCLPIEPKNPHNLARFYPIVEVYDGREKQPDGMTSFQYYNCRSDMKIFRAEEYESVHSIETKIFDACITVKWAEKSK